MAPPTLTPQIISLAGVVATYQAAAGAGDTLPCNSTAFLIYRNAGGSPIVVTVNRPPSATYEPNVAITPVAVTVPAGGERWFGPVSKDFIDINLGDPGTFITGASKGTLASVSYSPNAVGLTVALLRFREPGDA